MAGRHATPRAGRLRRAAGRLAAVVLAVAASGAVGTPPAARGAHDQVPTATSTALPGPAAAESLPSRDADDPVGHGYVHPPKTNTRPAGPLPGVRTQPAVPPRTIRLVRGDTLWALAIRYHTSVRALQQLNHLGSATLIFAGRSFAIPGTGAAVPPPSTVPTAPTHPAPPRTSLSAPIGTDTARILAFAYAQIGKPYLWGGTGPVGFDCSGLVQQAYTASGIRLPRGAADQSRAGIRISRDQLRPGDLVFSYGFDHVQLYVGDGRVIEAAHPGTVIRISILPPASQVDAYVHIPAVT